MKVLEQGKICAIPVRYLKGDWEPYNFMWSELVLITKCVQHYSMFLRREFIKKNYRDLKVLNPGLPIYVRPSEGVEPHVAARYGTIPIALQND